MREIRHHPTKSLLMAHAAGTLSDAFDLVVATHVSVCDECRAEIGAFETLGGSLLESATPVPPMAGSLAAVLERPVADPPPIPPADPVSVFPAPLRRVARGDLSTIRWRRLGGGVSQAVLAKSGTSSVRLLRIAAGVAVPDHGHKGSELTMVLAGAFEDETDRFGAGDVEIADPTLVHQPVAALGEDCICLAATDAPLRFRSLLPRLAQPLFGI